MNLVLKIGWAASSLLVMTACNAATTAVSDRLILGDGLVDVEIVSGSELTEDCGSIIEGLENAEYKCVEFPMNSERQWDGLYMSALEADGWQHLGGAANGSDFRKAIDDRCFRKLGMGFWFQASAEQEARVQADNTTDGIDTAVIIFTLQDDAVCRPDGSLR